ncbi:TIM barrel protein [bacterium]|nr:TIM barrel protein [bacterium]
MADRPLTRRTILRQLSGAVATGLLATSRTTAAEASRTGLGLVTYCVKFRRDDLRQRDANVDLYQPQQFLEHCRSLGAGGMQCSLGILDASAARELRRSAEQNCLSIEAIVRLPEKNSEFDRLNAELQTAAAVGAKAARTTIMPGRRYEFFDSLEKFNEYDTRGRRMIEQAAPLAAKHRVPLAVENHKDHRDEQRIALFEHISSEFVGACVDTGNSFALLEDPLETVRRFAPWAHSVHLKDQALQPHPEGFLLADIPLGQGAMPLPEMVRILKTAKPDIRFSLELITRDPLVVPCLTEKYWATLSDVPAPDLARTLRYVHEKSTNNLQYPSKMTPGQQLALEDANVQASLDYARESLGL